MSSQSVLRVNHWNWNIYYSIKASRAVFVNFPTYPLHFGPILFSNKGCICYFRLISEMLSEWFVVYWREEPMIRFSSKPCGSYRVKCGEGFGVMKLHHFPLLFRNSMVIRTIHENVNLWMFYCNEKWWNILCFTEIKNDYERYTLLLKDWKYFTWFCCIGRYSGWRLLLGEEKKVIKSLNFKLSSCYSSLKYLLSR